MIDPASIDVSLLLWLNGDGGAVVDSLMYCASARLTWVPLYVVLVWALWRKEGLGNVLRFMVLMALVVLVADQIANLAKFGLPKFRPSHYEPLQGLIHTVGDYRGGLYGTISSHAANSVAVMVMCCSVLRVRWVWVALSAWVLLVCYSRIYLAVHYPADILLGLIEGVIVGSSGVWGYLRWKTYVSRRYEDQENP